MLQRMLSIIVVLIIFTFHSAAQKTDQISLKNGSIIRGSIEKIIPDNSVSIIDHAGNTWVFKMDEVEQIEKVEANIMNVSDRSRQADPIISYSNTGLVNMTTIGFLPGSQGSQYRAPLSVQTSFGYRSSFGLYSGVLAGLEFLNITHIPLMLDLQYDLFGGEVRPVVIARGGYVIPSKGESDYYGTIYTYSGGLSGAIGMGLKIHTKEHFAWDVSLLYRYMEINYVEEYEWQSYPNTYKDVYNRLEIRLGFYLGR